MQMNMEWKILMNSFKIPKIRFMNFNDKWKYIILGEISNSIEYGLNAAAKAFDGIHKYLRITDIDDSSRLFLTDKLSSPDVNFTEEDYENYKLQKNDLLFARTGASVGKTYLYRESDGEVYYAGFLIRARLRDSFDGNFVFQQTLTDKYKQFIEITSQRSGQPGVNGKEYGEWKIGMTSYHEQSAIGSLFRTLDELLASYKDNLANYQSLKATMLSKMFPKAGQNVPEIRLDGFEGEWENSKISDYVYLLNGRAFKQDELLNEGKYRVVRVGNFNTNEKWYYSNLELEENKYANKDDLLYLWATNFGPEIWKEEKIIFHYHIWKLEFDRSIIDRNYLYYWLEKDKKRIQQNTNGSTMVHVTKSMMENREFLFPMFREQQAIGTYFSNLDSLITAYQEKISQLETLKKKLLQDMFI